MSHLAEDIDSAPAEARVVSAQVGQGFEALDPIATSIKFDMEHRSTKEPGDAVDESTKEAQSSRPLPIINRNHQARSVPAKDVAYQEQFNRAIAMSSAELGKAIKEPTKRITKLIGQALAHEEKVKTARDQAQAEFSKNIGYYYEVKQRLLNPGYRTGVDGGKDRTSDENQKNFGAPTWEMFNANCKAYSLQHADRLLKQFAKANDLLADDGGNIDDPEPIDDAPAGSGRRSTNDITAQKRYEHVATAAMAIAHRNPEGEVEKQILAAAEYIPTPATPLAPDIYTEVLSFVTMIATLAPTENVKADARKLLGKLLLFRPAPDPAKILAEATVEEKRKRDRRLAKKNGRPLATSEHVQRLEPGPCADAEVAQAGVNSGSECDLYLPATVTAKVPLARKRLNLGDDVIGAPFRAQHSGGENPVVRKEVSALAAEKAMPSAISTAERFLPHGERTRTQLVPGKKYQVRPAPSGGYGIYESRSTVLLQWYEEEDEARDAIDPATAISLGA